MGLDSVDTKRMNPMLMGLQDLLICCESRCVILPAEFEELIFLMQNRDSRSDFTLITWKIRLRAKRPHPQWNLFNGTTETVASLPTKIVRH